MLINSRTLKLSIKKHKTKLCYIYYFCPAIFEIPPTVGRRNNTRATMTSSCKTSIGRAKENKTNTTRARR